MKKYFYILCLTFVNVTFAADFHCTPLQEIHWKELAPGVLWTKYDVSFNPYNKDLHEWELKQTRSVTVRAFKIDFTKNKLLFHSAKTDLECLPNQDRYISKLIADSNAPVIGAINSSFFIMPNGHIQGLAIDENKVWSKDLTEQTISSSGVFSIENGKPNLETREDFMHRFGSIISDGDASKFSFAVQAYPKLLIQNELQITDSVLNSRRPRTSIGVAENPDEIILVTIDARGETDSTGMTLFEYAHFVNESQCGVGQKTVLNLDGGGSSSFAIPSLNIFEQADHCRHLGNILTIQSR